MGLQKKYDKQTSKNSHFFQSLFHAIDGILLIFLEERNIRYHMLIAMIPIILGFYFGITTIEWVMIVFCILLVLLMEFINTIFENIVDLITEKKFSLIAKNVKDIAAGGVLLVTIFVVIVALIIFGPHLIDFFIEGALLL